MGSSLRCLISAVALLASLPALADTPPSHEQVKAWAPAEQKAMGITVETLVPVTLAGKEQAYLAGVSYEEAARNFWAGYLLVRPKLKQARALEEFGGQYNGIQLLGDPGPEQSLVLIGSASSGQGIMEKTYAVVRFDGWTAKTLYSAAEEDNSGNCGADMEVYCKGNDVFINALSVPAPAGKLALAVTQVSYSSPDLETTPAKITQEVQVVFVDKPGS
jgi:hypothetical protein